MKRKKGLSLIVLVITIIVMIVLAGVVVITLNNSGIIDQATDAVEQTNIAAVKELTQIAWAEAYANGARTKNELQAAVDKALADNSIDTEQYGINVTTSGVQVENGWIQDGLTVKRGKTVLEVGDFVGYDAGVATYTSTWQVLGAEDGKLLIMSTGAVETNYELEGADGYINGVSKLNTICEPYGKGKGAEGARCVRIEDVDKITGFNKTTYGKGAIEEYGNKVTYWWTGNDDPYYTSSNGNKGDLQVAHEGTFYYFNGQDFVKSSNLGATKENPIEITTLKSDEYRYYGTTLTGNQIEEVKGLEADSKAYIMLFSGGTSTYSGYWLASPCVGTNDGGVCYSLRMVLDWMYTGLVEYCPMCSSIDGSHGGASYNVRAVVSLASNIQLNGSSEAGWKF